MSTTEIFLIAMVLIFAIPYLVWRVGRTEYYAPLVVVQILLGILLGPGILGAVFPGYYAFVFNPAVVQSLNGVAWWAVMLFVWIAGIELDLTGVWANLFPALRKAERPRRSSSNTTAGAGRAPRRGSSRSAWGWPARSRRSRS